MNDNRERFSIVCLSSQDWNAALPTNRQQIMLRAAAGGHQILFIETGHFLGVHLWRLARGGRRGSLFRRLFATEPVADGIRVRKALNIVPWGQRLAIAGTVNGALTSLLVRRLVRKLPHPVVLWIYDPCTASMVGSSDDALAVYDCVDDYVEQVGGNPRRRAVIRAADAQAARAARLVFTTTKGLYARQSAVNAQTHLVGNVGDYGHFAVAADRRGAAAEALELRRPVLGFAGNFLAAKVDFELIGELARARPEWTLLLVGPAAGGSERWLEQLLTLPNLRWLGPKPYGDLPAYVAAFDVGLIPYLANEYTKNCFPLKLYEYLAAGKPVVASGLPELAGMEPDVVLAAGVDDFAQAVESALTQLSPADTARRMALAAENTWERRAGRLLDLVSEQLAS